MYTNAMQVRPKNEYETCISSGHTNSYNLQTYLASVYLDRGAILAVLLFCFSPFYCAGFEIKVIGQLIGATAPAIRAVSIKAPFIEKREQSFSISEYGYFSGTIEVKESGIATISFQNYAYHVVLASEPILRIRIESLGNNKMDIRIEDSKENDAYLYAKVLMKDQFRMYSYFASCDLDSCLRMIQIEQQSYRYHRDSLSLIYPHTYATDVLYHLFDFNTPKQAKALPAFIKNELLDRTPWQIDNVYNGKVMNNLVELYLQYAPDSGLAQRISLMKLIEKTSYGSLARERLAAILFEIFESDRKEDGLKQFLALTNHPKDKLFLDPVLSEKCKRLAKSLSGEKAPEIMLPDRSSKEISLQKTAAGSKYTLLLIWDVDCEHCIAGLSVLNEIYEKYHGKGLEIYALCLSDDRDLCQRTIKQHNCTWINVQINEKGKAQPDEYFITYTPRLVLIDQQGVIVHRQLLIGEMAQTLAPLF